MNQPTPIGEINALTLQTIDKLLVAQMRASRRIGCAIEGQERVQFDKLFDDVLVMVGSLQKMALGGISK